MSLPTVDSSAKAAANAVGEATTSAAKGVADKVYDITIKPLKSLMTPAGIGGAVTIATKSPILGALAAGSLTTAGKAVKGLGSIGGSVVGDDPLTTNEPQTVDELRVGKLVVAGEENDNEEKNNDDLWDLLSEMLDNGEDLVDVQKRALFEEERTKLAELEAQRELSRMESERIELLEEILSGMYDQAPEEKKGGLLSWLAGALGLGALWKGSGGIKAFAKSFMAGLFGKQGIFRIAIMGAFNALRTTLLPALGTIIKRIVMSPITLLVGFYEALKIGLQERSIEGFIAGFFTGIVNLFTQFFGIQKEEVKAFMMDAVNGITDAIGQVIFSVWNAFDSLSNINFDLNLSGLIGDAIMKMKSYLGDVLQNELEEWTDILDSYGIIDMFKDLAASIVDLVGKLKTTINEVITQALDSIVGIVNSIPGVEIALTDAQRERNLDKKIAELEARKQEIMAKETSEGFFGYSQADKNKDLMALNMELGELNKARKMARGGIVRSATNAIVGEGADELVTPLHRLDDLVVNPAVAQTLALVRKNEESRQLQGGMGGTMEAPIITPISNTVVQQKQATPFVAPISRRNNENTFQRVHESLHNGKLI